MQEKTSVSVGLQERFLQSCVACYPGYRRVNHKSGRAAFSKDHPQLPHSGYDCGVRRGSVAGWPNKPNQSSESVNKQTDAERDTDTDRDRSRDRDRTCGKMIKIMIQK